jgi:glycosyltransferase involved in cell wall biosynthesis
LRAVDIAIVPYPDDSFAPVIVCAAAAGKTLIASEGGLAGELLDYGRRGVLFRSGSESELASRMQDIIAAWPHGSPLIRSAAEILAESSPKRCAEVVRSAYLRLTEEQHAKPSCASITPLKRAR